MKPIACRTTTKLALKITEHCVIIPVIKLGVISIPYQIAAHQLMDWIVSIIIKDGILHLTV